MKTQNSSNENATQTRRTLSGAPRRKWTAWAALVAALLALTAAAQPVENGIGGKRDVDVMQVNLYVGGGIERAVALDPTDPNYPAELVAAVTGIYYEIAASQPAARLQGAADAIAARMPDLVSVEEASLIRIQSPGDLMYGGTSPATNIVFDYLQILTNALAARGAHYAVVASQSEVDVEMPMLNLAAGSVDDVRLTDREAILARTDLPPGQLRVANPQGGHFTNVLAFPAIGLTLERGWCSVDVSIRGRDFRYICPHLEEETAPQIQVLEAQELLSEPANTSLPVLMVGDFNADPLGRDGSIAYALFPAAGFDDAWAVLHPDTPADGLTWGHDEFLADPTVPFNRRIDFVFYRGAGFVPQTADVLDLWLDRDAPPFWASDHATVSAGFQIH